MSTVDVGEHQIDDFSSAACRLFPSESNSSLLSLTRRSIRFVLAFSIREEISDEDAKETLRSHLISRSTGFESLHDQCTRQSLFSLCCDQSFRFECGNRSLHVLCETSVSQSMVRRTEATDVDERERHLGFDATIIVFVK